VKSELHRFDRDTALTLVETRPNDGVVVFDGRIDAGWWIIAGPNGGYLNAILLRAMRNAVADPVREPRSQTTHFIARAKPGPVQLTVRVLRSGGSLSTVTTQLDQDGRLIAYSLAALGTPRMSEPPPMSFQDASMPQVASPVECELVANDGPVAAFRDRFEQRPVFGLGEPAMEATATVGGWIRPSPGRAGDALMLATLSDAWRPAVFSKRPPGPQHRGVPTVELTVHYRAPAVAAAVPPDGYYLVRFRTRVARDGYLEEDGEIWSEQGILLAQSRQLALFA